ncbi:MAG: IS4 family transposase [Lachnoclostridium sp.]|nr:IS4 family transposase [Lachnoclostridium sp.]
MNCYQNIFTRILICIRHLLSSDDFLNCHRVEKHFVRKRKLSLRHVVFYLLHTNRCAMHQNLSRICDELPEIDFPEHISKQALSKARQWILPSLFKELFALSTRTYYEMVNHRKTWNGYHVFAVDGSKLQLPNSRGNLALFGKRFNTSNPSQVYSMALCSVLYDVLEDIIVDCSLHPDLFSERLAATGHLNAFNSLDLAQNSIIIYDRGYYSEKMYRFFYNNDIFCLMRLKGSMRITRSSSDDSIFMLDPGNHAASDTPGCESIPIRVIRVELDSGITEYLATNVMDPDITPEMFKDLYFLRWKIESKYNELKNRLEMEEFSGATPVSVEQEFYINMLCSNLCAIVKNDADEKIAASSRPDNKYKYQANRSFIIGRFKDLFTKLLCGKFQRSMICELFHSAARHRSQIQPGRKFARKKKKDNLRNHFNHKKSAI